MKEKIILLIALSFLISLTVYKKSLDTNVELANNMQFDNKQDVIKKSTMKNTNLESNSRTNYSSCDSNQLDIDTLQFNEAFKHYRNCNYDTFIWNGIEYTTMLKSEINHTLEKNHKLLSNRQDLVLE